MIVIDCKTYGNHTHLQNWSRWKPAAGGDHGDGVLCFLFCVVCCCVCERRLVLGCRPLAHKYNISHYGIILGVGICIVVQDTYAILVKYLAQENGRREKNDKSVVCVVCCKKLLP
jgi:hypothetical protein